MAFSCVMKICVYVMFFCAMTYSAPIADQVTKDQANAVAPETPKVPQEEQDLHELLELVDTQAHKDNVLVHKEHTSHVTNHDGKTTKVEQKEEKVVDAKSGDVIADVKQETKQQAPEQGQEPDTVVKTEVQLPASGVDQTYIQEGSQPASSEDIDSQVEDVHSEAEQADADIDELTAEDMAEFLVATQQIEAFFPALQRLVNQSKMTVAEAQAYARSVMDNIDRIQMEELTARANEEKRDYMQYMGGSALPADDLLAQGYLPSPSLDAVPQEAAIPMYMPPMDTYRAQRLLQQQSIPDFLRDDPVRFLFSLFDAAYEKGDPGAQDVINMLYERISQSDDPSDLDLIRNLEKHYNDLYRPMETYVELPEDLWTNQVAEYGQDQLPVTEEEEEIQSNEIGQGESNGVITENKDNTSQDEDAKKEEEEIVEKVKEETDEKEAEEELENMLSSKHASKDSETDQQE